MTFSLLCKELEALLLWEPDQVTGNTTSFFKKILKALPNARITSYYPVCLFKSHVFASTDNWVTVLGKEYRKHGREKPFEEPEAPVPPEEDEGEQSREQPPKELSLNDFDLQTRVQILFDLCEFHLRHVQHFTETLLKGVDAGLHWRFEPLGRDTKGLQYWLFDDGRLFREETEGKGSPVGVKDSWELVCWDRDTWRRFLDEELTSKPGDRKLKESLQEEWQAIDATLQEQERLAKKKSKELSLLRLTHDLLPRKRSSRLQAKESMQRLREQEEAEERSARLKAEAEARKAAGKPALVEAAEAIGGRGLSREERAEQRRQRVEREAEERVLRELEEERRRNEPPQPEVVVDVLAEEEEEEEEQKPLKLVIRRSSIPGQEQPAKKAKTSKPKQAPAQKEETQHQQRVLSLMQQAIQRELAQRMKVQQPVQQMQQGYPPNAGFPQGQMPFLARPPMAQQQQQMSAPFLHSGYQMQARPQYPMQARPQFPMQPQFHPAQHGQYMQAMPPMGPMRPMGHPHGQMQPVGHPQGQPQEQMPVLRPQGYMPRPLIQELQQPTTVNSSVAVPVNGNAVPPLTETPSAPLPPPTAPDASNDHQA